MALLRSRLQPPTSSWHPKQHTGCPLRLLPKPLRQELWRSGARSAQQFPHVCGAVTTAPTTAKAVSELRTLWPTPTKPPLESGLIAASSIHSIYYEVHGNPNGFPAVIVHGGPGAGCFLNHTRFFDLDHYKVILLDQRGCGRSTPRGCLIDNNTPALVADMERLRQHLGVERWLLFGGSWGVALSLAYALEHGDRCAGVHSCVLPGHPRESVLQFACNRYRCAPMPMW